MNATATTGYREIGQEYNDSSTHYEQLASKKLNDMIVLAGFGCGLKVEKNALVCKQGFTHSDQKVTSQTLYRGVHGVSSIVILSDSGNISLNAIKWATEQEISVFILDRDGSLLQALTPEHASNASLRKAQYMAVDSEKAAYISYRILCEKAKTQRQTLEKHEQELPDATRAIEIFNDSSKWLALPELPRWKEVAFVMQFEARLASDYFEAWSGLQINFTKSDSKKVPPHWLHFSNRGSLLSKGHGARHSTNPVNSILNYAYSVLEGQVRQSLVAAGFDLSVAVLHSIKSNRDSLVYDVMDMGLRSEVDHLVLKLVSSTTFKKGDFIETVEGECRLTAQLARFVVAVCSIDSRHIQEAVARLKALYLN